MVEQGIDWNVNDDPTPVVIDDKQKKEIFEELKGVIQMSQFLNYYLTEEKLTKGLQENLTTLLDKKLGTVCSILGYKTAFEAEREKDKKKIRALYKENHELREQLGQKVTLEDCRENMKLIADGFRYWNDNYGFADYAQNIKFTDYGSLECQLHLSLEDDDARKRMEDYGFEIGNTDGEYPHPLATKENFELLTKFFNSFSPYMYAHRAEIWDADTIPVIRSVELHVRELDWIQPYIDMMLKQRASNREKKAKEDSKL